MNRNLKTMAGVSVKVRSFSYAPHRFTCSDLPILNSFKSFLNASKKSDCNSAEGQ